ncbi:MAG: hypothetical protein A2176_10460 [Spirochaetes bacterium RBG_13_51_14]|nr:MAG: hypothetical protein A2176_10460 [Spirochaetes bacterium RBG_13_51_14]
MLKRLCITAFALIILAGTSVTAQENQNEKNDAEKKAADEQKKADEDRKIMEGIKDIYRRLSIGVKIYMDWYSAWGWDNAAYDRVGKYKNRWSNGLGTALADINPKNSNSFRINRAYLDVKYKIHDVLSARLTTDVDATVTPTGASNAAFHIYLKYAYIEAKKDFGPVMLSAAGGLIETPVIGFIDKLSDYRWITQNYIDNAKVVLNNTSIDNSADLGVKASIGMMKWVTLTGSFTNGEGYKSNENLSEKAITFLVDVNPAPIEAIKGLHFIGMGRYEITNKYDWTGKKAKREFFGYGVHYSTDLIKVGFNHIFAYVRQVGLASAFNPAFVFGTQQLYIYPQRWQGYELLDVYLNFNLGAVVSTVPLLINGRYVHGLQRKTYQKQITDPEFAKTRNTDLYGFGVGWQFNKNFRIMIGGEIQRFFVKKNVFWRYQESAASGTDWHRTDIWTGAVTSTFLGSKNPNNAKRLYVKAEVTF